MYHNRMALVIVLLVYLIMVNQYVECKVITIKNNGSNTTACCVRGECPCNSFIHALSSVKSHTIISVTENIALNDTVYIEQGLNDVTITGNDVMIMCNNKGGMSWGSGNNIVIEGITWDQCGNPEDPSTPAIKFDNVCDVSFIRCTFQYSKVCRTVDLALVENSEVHIINVTNSRFISNRLQDPYACNDSHGSIMIWNKLEGAPIIIGKLEVYISGTTFEFNGNLDEPQRNETIAIAALNCYLHSPLNLVLFLVDNSTFSSNEMLGMYLNNLAISDSSWMYIIFNNIIVFNNSKSGINIISGIYTMLDVMSSVFIENSNGALILDYVNKNSVLNFTDTAFLRNSGTSGSQGAALYVHADNNTVININNCNFDHNNANGGDGIVHITNMGVSLEFGHYINVLVSSSSFFSNKLGPALHISQVVLQFYNSTLFQNNSAESGAAIFVDHNALIIVTDESFVQFVNNTASLRGGAIYADLTNCINNGILFSPLSSPSSIVFINNAARISGNSIYFNIPKSCNVQSDINKEDSVAYIPYKLKYIQSEYITGHPIAASPHRISICLPHTCIHTNENCSISEGKMLGQSIYFDATVCDYFNHIAETVPFKIKCTNCGVKYMLLKSEILINNRLPDKVIFLSKNSSHDVINDTIVTLEILSTLFDGHKEIIGTLSVTLSSCYNGFLFNSISQKCECYSSANNNDIMDCQEYYAEIKEGYWHGIISQKRTSSLCSVNYCDFHYRTETRKDFYSLPKEVDGQCRSHRTGVVCSDCKAGYTLAYDSFDCINEDQCSPGMTVLVIGLTFLYWILIVTVLFVLTYYFSTQVSSGYFNGVIYFYSIVDIILASKLYIIDGLFYTVAILSSFAKLTPQFLGKLCLAKGLDAIDQQFIHYFHTLCISFILIGIVITGKCFNKVAFYVNRHVTRVTFLFLMLSYTSVTSTSLQLLRGIQFDDVDGVFVYLSPHFKYYTQRHAVYATVALLCGLSITIGLPLLLLIEPFLRKIPIFNYFRTLLDQFQGTYKDKYQWFAANYLLCRLVIMLIAYFGNSDDSNLVYYMQTACVIIVMNHVCFRPYKKQLLNVLDAAVLLTMLLVVNLNNVDFSKSAITGLIYTLLFIPLLLVFGLGFSKLFLSFKAKFIAIHNPGTIQR